MSLLQQVKTYVCIYLVLVGQTVQQLCTHMYMYLYMSTFSFIATESALKANVCKCVCMASQRVCQHNTITVCAECVYVCY